MMLIFPQKMLAGQGLHLFYFTAELGEASLERDKSATSAFSG